MLLFQRQIHLSGGPPAMAWANEVTASVQKHAQSPVSLWLGSYGMAPGWIAWSAPIESLSQVDELNAATAADADHMALIAQGAEFVNDAEPDRLLALVSGELEGQAAVGSYVEAARAVAAPGKWGAAGEWAVHVAGVYTEVTGLPVVVASTVAGPMGEMSWLVRHDDGVSIETAIGKTMASEAYMAELERGGEFFLPGATQVYGQRIA
jgi:hypothetical protein